MRDRHGHDHFVPTLFSVHFGFVSTFGPFYEFVFQFTIFGAILFINLLKIIWRQRHQRLGRTLQAVLSVLFSEFCALLCFPFLKVKSINTKIKFVLIFELTCSRYSTEIWSQESWALRDQTDQTHLKSDCRNLLSCSFYWLCQCLYLVILAFSEPKSRHLTQPTKRSNELLKTS